MFHGQELVLTNKNMSIISINKLEKSELNIVQMKMLTSQFDGYYAILQITHSRGKRYLLHCNLLSVFN